MSSSPDISSLNLARVSRVRRGNPLRTAPNLLTMLRIFLVPLLVGSILERRYVLAFALFLVAAMTDAADGLLARWLRQRTMLGQYLDPLADKLLLSSLFVALTYRGALEPRVALLVFSRDIGMLLTALILYLTVNLRDFRPSKLGKANSFSQVVAVGAVLLSLIDQHSWVTTLRVAALDTTMALTVLSGFHYAWVSWVRIGVVTAEQPQESSPSMRNDQPRPEPARSER